MIIVLNLKLPRILLCEHWHGFIMIIESIWEEIAINGYKFRIRVVSKLQTVIVAVWCWYNEEIWPRIYYRLCGSQNIYFAWSLKIQCS